MFRSIFTSCKALLLASAMIAVPAAANAASVSGSTAIASVAVAGSAASVAPWNGHELEDLSMLPATASLVTVVAMHSTIQGSLAVVEFTVDGSKKVAKLVFEGLEKGALSVGQQIRIVTTASGQVLTSMGEVLAFLPNQEPWGTWHNERLWP